jgi:hypothetical protein
MLFPEVALQRTSTLTPDPNTRGAMFLWTSNDRMTKVRVSSPFKAHHEHQENTEHGEGNSNLFRHTKLLMEYLLSRTKKHLALESDKCNVLHQPIVPLRSEVIRKESRTPSKHVRKLLTLRPPRPLGIRT